MPLRADTKRSMTRASASDEALERARELMDAADAYGVNGIGDRIEQSNVASMEGTERLEASSDSIGSSARVSRMMSTARPRRGGGAGTTASESNGGKDLRRTYKRARRTTIAVKQANEGLRGLADDDEGIDGFDAIVEDVTSRTHDVGGMLAWPVGAATKHVAGKGLGKGMRKVGERLTKAGAGERLTKEHQEEDLLPDITAIGGGPAEATDENVDRDAVKSARRGSALRHGVSARAAATAKTLDGGLTRAERLARTEAATTRALGSSTSVAVSQGMADIVPSALTSIARQSLARMAEAAAQLMVRATAAAAAAVTASVPVVLPAIIVATLAFSVISAVATIAADQAQHKMGGGQAIAAIAEQEYQSGVAAGDYHQGGEKYRSWAGVNDEWCAVFVSWCANQCGFIDQHIIPKTWCAEHDAFYPPNSTEYQGQCFYGASEYTSPAPGDIFLYGGLAEGVGNSSHVALVTQVLPDGSFYTVEGNTGGGGHWSARIVGKKLHEKYDGGYTGTMWAGDFAVVRPAYPVGADGQVIEIPEPYGNGGYTVTEYDLWYGDWADGTNQRAVADEWATQGMKWKDDIASVDGRYLVACTTTYGTVGDYLTFYLSDGTAIPCIMADAKSMNDPGCNMWGHSDGQNVLEFEVRSARYQACGNPGTNGWLMGWAGKRVVRCVNESRVQAGVTSEGVMAAVDYAVSMVGKPYVTDANSPDVGFDCSGLVWWAYTQAGYDIPRGQQYARNGTDSMMYRVYNGGGWVTDRSQLKAGDLMFYGSDWQYTGHVAMCIGNGQMVHADGYSVSIIGIYDWGGFIGGGPIV